MISSIGLISAAILAVGVFICYVLILTSQGGKFTLGPESFYLPGLASGAGFLVFSVASMLFASSKIHKSIVYVLSLLIVGISIALFIGASDVNAELSAQPNIVSNIQKSIDYARSNAKPVPYGEYAYLYFYKFTPGLTIASGTLAIVSVLSKIFLKK